MPHADEIWSIIRKHVSRGRWVGLQEIYEIVRARAEFTPDDWVPEAPGSSQYRWQRNVRNVLVSRRKRGDLEDDLAGRYLFPARDQRWRDAVVDALRRHTEERGSLIVRRTEFLEAELAQIVRATGSRGRTPEQTVSRVLQELRDDGLLLFPDDRGTYVFTEHPADLENLDLPDDAVDEGLLKGRLRFGRVPTSDATGQTRQRRGQERLRRLTLWNYDCCCALCDVAEECLLVTSHIMPWSESVEGRGDLSNVLLLCRFHDPLFEHGHLSLSDDLTVLTQYAGISGMVRTVLKHVTGFNRPRTHLPAMECLAVHRERHGFGA